MKNNIEFSFKVTFLGKIKIIYRELSICNDKGDFEWTQWKDCDVYKLPDIIKKFTLSEKEPFGWLNLIDYTFIPFDKQTSPGHEYILVYKDK